LGGAASGGMYGVRVSEPAKFIVQVAGTNRVFTTYGISDQVRNFMVSRLPRRGRGQVPRAGPGRKSANVVVTSFSHSRFSSVRRNDQASSA